MKAIILNSDGTTYESVVFAMEYKISPFGFLSKVWFYVTDKTGNAIQRLSEYVEFTRCLHTQIVIRHDTHFENSTWKKGKNIEGYDWFINNKLCLKQIKKCHLNDLTFLNKCIEFNRKALDFYKDIDYKEIKCQRDAEDLLIFAKCFHDAVIDNYHTEDDKLVLTLIGVWGLKSLTLTFEGNITSHFIDTKAYADYFDSASLFIADDGQVCLVSSEGFDNKVIEEEGLYYFFADKLTFDYTFDFDWNDEKSWDF